MHFCIFPLFIHASFHTADKDLNLIFILHFLEIASPKTTHPAKMERLINSSLCHCDRYKLRVLHSCNIHGPAEPVFARAGVKKQPRRENSNPARAALQALSQHSWLYPHASIFSSDVAQHLEHPTRELQSVFKSVFTPNGFQKSSPAGR